MISKLGLMKLASALACGAALVVAGCGSSSNNSSSSSASAGAPVAGAPAWCGRKKITLALADGFGSNNWRRVVVGEARDEASKCPSVTNFVYTNGEGNA